MRKLIDALKEAIERLRGNRRALIAVGAAAAVLVAVVAALTMLGGLRLPWTRSGTRLTAKLVEGRETTYRVRVEALTPVWSAKEQTELSEGMTLKLKVTFAQETSDDWIKVGAEILEGLFEVGGKPRNLPLKGQSVAFKFSEMRRISAWRGLMFPTGIELLTVGTPKGRLQAGERWKVDVRRALLHHQEEVGFVKFFTFLGESRYAGRSCYKLGVEIPPVEATLDGGVVLKFGGSGDVHISSRDGIVLAATEVLEGQMTRKGDAEKGPGRFAQSTALYEATVAPSPLPSLLAKAPVSGTVAGATPAVSATGTGEATTAGPAPDEPEPVKPEAEKPEAGKAEPAEAPPAPAKPAAAAAETEGRPEPKAAAKPTMEERLLYVSNATGKRQIWSVGSTGVPRACLTGYEFPHWAPAIDPSGMKMACVSDRGRGVNVWMFSPGLSGGAPLTEFGEDEDIRIGWADRGNRLILLRDGKLWSMHPDGFNIQTFDLEGVVVGFAAVVAGTKVAVVTNRLNQDKIVIVDVISGSVKELFEGDLPSWSPDAKKLAFRTGDSLNVSTADGSLVEQRHKANLATSPILWSPDGKRLACTVIETGVEHVILVEDSKDAVTTRITKRGGQAHAFSRKGDRIAYLYFGDLWIGSIDGNIHTRLTSDGAATAPVWWGSHRVK